MGNSKTLPTSLTNRLAFPVLYITETHSVFESEQTGVVEGGTSLPSIPTPRSPDAENQDGFLQKIAKNAKSP